MFYTLWININTISRKIIERKKERISLKRVRLENPYTLREKIMIPGRGGAGFLRVGFMPTKPAALLLI